MIDQFADRKAKMNRFKVSTSDIVFINKLLVKHFSEGGRAPNQPLAWAH